ncbi:MAG: DUF2442 domain-containing protein [Candidatus Wallbacteria bacterium]|nr:DUF2442 domain-containing protein [Candidatus Wallbacteria bacterium]
MYHEITHFRMLENFSLELTFENGKAGIVDLSGYAEKGGVFSNFKDAEYFRKVDLNKELGVLCWPGGVDIAPETLYHLATGEPLPGWMES